MARPLLWYGELTTRPRLLRRGGALLGPAMLWLVVFLAIPTLGLVALSFMERGDYGSVRWAFSLENFRRLAGFSSYGGWSGALLAILLRSVWLAAVTTLISLLLAYPMAFFVASRPPRARYLLLGLIMVPFCTNMVIRLYAWKLLLSKDLPLAAAARWLGLISEGSLEPSALAVYIGMVSCFLPFAILPLYTNVERIDWSIVEAAQDLYASRWGTFRHAILPQTIPGLAAAVILTFIPAMGTFVVPDMLGGSNHMLIGNLIQQQFGPSRNLPYGSAISFGLMALTLLVLALLRKRIPTEAA